MMTDGDVSARDSALEGSGTPAPRSDAVSLNMPGQSTIAELLAVQAIAPKRSVLGRIFGANPLTTASRASFRAAVGEMAVGEQLAALGGEWTILHSVPVGEGAASVDHLVIGPGGVFIINTSVHAGSQVWASQRTFMVGDIRYPFIRNMEYEMGRVERLLSTAAARPVEVSGILAVVDPKSLTVREPHRDVAVVQASGVGRWIRGRARVLPPTEVAEIASAARKSGTWFAREEIVDPTDLRTRFEALERQVARAWNLQKMWATVITVLGAGGFILVTYTILVNALET
jgi:hypothetical protein